MSYWLYGNILVFTKEVAGLNNSFDDKNVLLQNSPKLVKTFREISNTEIVFISRKVFMLQVTKTTRI